MKTCGKDAHSLLAFSSRCLAASKLERKYARLEAAFYHGPDRKFFILHSLLAISKFSCALAASRKPRYNFPVVFSVPLCLCGSIEFEPQRHRGKEKT